MDKDLVDRLREHADRRPVAVPDTDGEVRAALDRLDELLGAVVDDDGLRSPTAAGQLTPAARQALWRLSRVVSEAERGPVAQPVAPDGRYELVPLAWAAVERADLIAVGLAVQALGRAWGLGDDEDVANAVAELAEAYRMKPEDLVAEAARLHGLLSLPWDDDVALLADVLAAGAGRVVLDAAAHQAYERVVGRILGIWHVGDPLAPWLYRGR
ncbi:MAG TPA: hypothetical protein VFJ85_01400 [Acidimicrobiales bacterium]|nr:hypothetical protein [Acidimicrobiales bacterium]